MVCVILDSSYYTVFSSKCGLDSLFLFVINKRVTHHNLHDFEMSPVQDGIVPIRNVLVLILYSGRKRITRSLLSFVFFKFQCLQFQISTGRFTVLMFAFRDFQWHTEPVDLCFTCLCFHSCVFQYWVLFIICAFPFFFIFSMGVPYFPLLFYWREKHIWVYFKKVCLFVFHRILKPI